MLLLSDLKELGGYTITIKNHQFEASYCHCSPDFLVDLNSYVSIGKQIGYVGPKNVYNVPNNPYKDSLGNPSNGATTGCHLHFTLKENGSAINPLTYLPYN